jgi:exodeoxyribonuclease III
MAVEDAAAIREQSSEMARPPFKLISLNVRNGGGTRVAAICQFLGRHKPDVIVLTEWRESTSGRNFIAWIESQGLHYARLNDGSTANGVFLAARIPFQVMTMTPHGSAPGVLMLARFQSWTLLASYFPQGAFKARFFTACAEIAVAHAETPFTIIGDLNTGNQLVDKSAGGARYFCAEGFDALTSKASLVDLWRRTNGTDAHEWTWLSNQNGFRIDHAFGNQPFVHLVQPSCIYDHRPREENITDHSALLITGITTKIAGLVQGYGAAGFDQDSGDQRAE